MALTLTDPNTEAGWLFLLLMGISITAYVLIRLILDWREDRKFWEEIKKNRRADR